MSQFEGPQYAPAKSIEDIFKAASLSQEAGLRRVDGVLRDYGADPRLHFLRGSFLAGLEQYADARAAMKRAIDIAPEYAVARFQLGLLELSSGESAAAEATWLPLLVLPVDSPLHLFVQGLRHMIRDEYEPAIRHLLAGIERNTENQPMNADMRLLIANMDETLAERKRLEAGDSAAHFLLQQYKAKPTQH